VEIVYLGMYTQFHVHTPAGRMVAYRLADEPLGELAAGSRVSLSWAAEQATVFGT
jgi:hypothetical protein